MLLSTLQKLIQKLNRRVDRAFSEYFRQAKWYKSRRRLLEMDPTKQKAATVYLRYARGAPVDILEQLTNSTFREITS